MRTLIDVRDVLVEYSLPAVCPRCDTQIVAFQATLDVSPKGRFLITKKALCEVHGYFSVERQVKAVQMYGKDAQIIPQGSASACKAKEEGSDGEGVHRSEE